eukprot:scaffold1596_cov302-Pinguiococcus_pyrenoidosus.AAC.46
MPTSSAVRKCVLPASGHMPMAHSGIAKVVVSVTRRTRAPMNRPAPAPMTTPLPRAITSFSLLNACKARSTLYSSSRNWRESSSFSSRESSAVSIPRRLLMSPPAQNALDSAPSVASADRTKTAATRSDSNTAARRIRRSIKFASTPSALSFRGEFRQISNKPLGWCVARTHSSSPSGRLARLRGFPGSSRAANSPRISSSEPVVCSSPGKAARNALSSNEAAKMRGRRALPANDRRTKPVPRDQCNCNSARKNILDCIVSHPHAR